MPEYIIELMDRNNLGNKKNIIDLGCGKGALLIKLAQKFDIQAMGIDIVPNFIEEALNYAQAYDVADKVEFKTEDILMTLKNPSQWDIVIYGYDSEVLGDLNHTLAQLESCIKKDGYIILEYTFADPLSDGMIQENEMLHTINQ